MRKWLFVGLGNQGKKYEQTRHNLGIQVLREWVAQLPDSVTTSTVTPWRMQENMSAEIATCTLNDAPETHIIAMFPLTNMNASGEAVAAAMKYAAIPIENVLVIHDDIELPFGEVKLAVSKSAAGHNGIRSVQAALGTKDVTRVRLGIGRPPEGIEVKDFVVATFTAEEQAALESIFTQTYQVLTDFITAKSELNEAPPLDPELVV